MNMRFVKVDLSGVIKLRQLNYTDFNLLGGNND